MRGVVNKRGGVGD